MPIYVWGSHNRGGEITYIHLGGLTYEFTITTCTDLGSATGADRPELYLDFCNSFWDEYGYLVTIVLQYCSNDVIYLHRIKEELYKMLVRENRLELYTSCVQFLKTRIKLDQNGFTEDIFHH